MSTKSIYLITGANRGIGHGFVQTYLARPNNVVIAAVRDTSSTSSKALSKLQPGNGSKLVVVKLDSLSDTDPKAAVSQIKSEGIDRIDTVIANAGIANWYGPALEAPAEVLREHYNVNAVAPLLLFQATWPLLELSSNPKFVYLSSILGSITDMYKYPIPDIVYGTSKAAGNFLVKKIQLENEALTAFSIHPGLVQTEMGNAGAQSLGLEKAPNTLEESINGLVSKIDSATKENAAGKFLTFDGVGSAW